MFSLPIAGRQRKPSATQPAPPAGSHPSPRPWRASDSTEAERRALAAAARLALACQDGEAAVAALPPVSLEDLRAFAQYAHRFHWEHGDTTGADLWSEIADNLAMCVILGEVQAREKVGDASCPVARPSPTPSIEAARLQLGAAAVISPTKAAELLPMSEAAAMKWMHRSGLIRTVDGRHLVVWGDVVTAVQSQGAHAMESLPTRAATGRRGLR